MLILGTASGTPLLSEAMRRWGRRRGLVGGYSVGAAGGLLAVSATVLSSFPLLLLGMFVLGLGHSANALTRYLMADLFPFERRATALSWVVWVGTIGAVLGPNLLDLR